jgi:hypothetical protein
MWIITRLLSSRPGRDADGTGHVDDLISDLDQELARARMAVIGRYQGPSTVKRVLRNATPSRS